VLFRSHSRRPVCSAEASRRRVGAAPTSYNEATKTHAVAYLIDRWPDGRVPLLEHEIEEMRKRNVPIVPIVCEFNVAARLTPVMKRLAEQLEFLPDAMVIEAEWRANTALAQKLEEIRASQTERSPAAVFLRQARFALMLQNWLRDKSISHLHATSSRALLCALLLQEIVELPVSAAIEPRPELSAVWIKRALVRCRGGRVSDRTLLEKASQPFLLEPKMRFGLGRPARFWKDWAKLIEGWRCGNRKSKTTSPVRTENRK